MTDLLLVEDDPAIVTALSDFLKREGFAVTAASGQTEALRLLEGRRFHLALLDVTLSAAAVILPPPPCIAPAAPQGFFSPCRLYRSIIQFRAALAPDFSLMIPYRSSIRVLAASAPNMARSASSGVTGFCVGLYAFILNPPENSLKRQERVHNPSEVKIYPPQG